MNDTDLLFHVFGQTGSYDPVLSHPDDPRLTHEGRLKEGRYPRLLLRWRLFPELLTLIRATGSAVFSDLPDTETAVVNEQAVVAVARACFRSGQQACALMLRSAEMTTVLEGCDILPDGPMSDDPAFESYLATLRGRWLRSHRWMLTRNDWTSLPQDAFLQGWWATFQAAPTQ